MSEVGTLTFIPETPPVGPGAGRLGRHRQWDPRNENHLVRTLQAPRPAASLPAKVWSRRLPVLDQGHVGACTEFAFAGCARTKPISGGLWYTHRKIVKDPIGLYSRLTQDDPYPGSYPPVDTGSSVLAAMDLGKKLGIISGYKWATEPNEAITGLALLGSGELGVDWHEGMDRPDDKGVVHATGYVRGGHAFQALGRVWDVDRWYWICVQSWGPGWPERPALGKPGHFAIPEDEVFGLLAARGEFAIPLRRI